MKKKNYFFQAVGKLRQKTGEALAVGKLRQKTGETLAETMISMLIVSLSVLMLAGAVVSSARVNTALENEEITFEIDSASETITSNVTVTIQDLTDSNTAAALTVDLHKTENGYTYYDYDSEAGA